MNCAEAKENIDGLMDGELCNPLDGEVEDHLRMCRLCHEIKEERVLLSAVLRASEIVPPSSLLDDRVLNAFREHHEKKHLRLWYGAIFGTFSIPKPVFAAILVLAVAAPWLAFQIGKINTSTILVPQPVFAVDRADPFLGPPRSETKTVIVEVPVIKEKVVTRTIYVQGSSKKRRVDSETGSSSNLLPSYNSVARRGYYTDLDLKGFQPPAKIGVQIIKEVKPNEK